MSKLILVPTPIGNLKDITFRALEALENADLILAEDTRQASKLLNHFNIKTPLQSHHMFNEHKSVESICNKLLSGQTIALVSDAGTPGISDPGFLLVRSCLEKEIAVETLPGPTALIPALVNSGLPSDRFCFEGFLPQKKGRNKRLSGLEEETRTMIFYESPYRLVRALREMSEHFGPEREACVSRELSKIYEENVRGTLSFLAGYYTDKPPKGEIVIVVSGKKL
ncbi:MAG: 16S rRNA (cytidine(1402)-2'-O)-methyltransferase [Bacteroidetes bacterium GWE2_41_25]|nr:MAG: 16S rRNA (cytidine(1402)-2'-O)-methyltransferase [Bacteroidetes bacterium GWA2_40_15]OFX91140.1 MAG: 16S rRNA (cytidine(1402)-2'-O)-methyltransferase [Bacteroidetes bacterium GWE2_41_25]OFX95331.1 MAG: 16S rRNA (cytidine(1402)-2'-O)-methyltransferase [Bacteroidetes bacterium GWC2_40_22]OFY57085.1 MAG: 16S rRNA (cytidine(1402)-2'-O)-methyltransferase [Bacteroidetes bacterium GWF2_41_9]HAM09603.1 16S rRNA (cytidine(1402)-2'-O)-methyltransferase [Bacteroidales bacterium]